MASDHGAAAAPAGSGFIARGFRGVPGGWPALSAIVELQLRRRDPDLQREDSVLRYLVRGRALQRR
ncbi:hypothetical protein RB620_24485 [Paenibacillus sp. LHD-117]|uniref:hypothetical protein n=1 Tax=Paenibacillus sp. LHD-117 TaxID=3071412 RepID=UPI0027E0BEFC|nr:hypothetical protein [Paenibacillus sp. LHD-117]MDQ6422594.1 hypothetical protein [Paenibacillus sp. LHD-117]